MEYQEEDELLVSRPIFERDTPGYKTEALPPVELITVTKSSIIAAEN